MTRPGSGARAGGAVTRRWGAVALVAGLSTGMLSACAPVVDDAWTAPAWAPSVVSVTDEPPPVDVTTDATLAGSLSALRVRNDAVGVHARALFLPGTGATVAPFNNAVQQTVIDAIDDRELASGAPFSPEAFDEGAGLGDRGCVAGSTGWNAVDILSDPATGPTGGEGAAVVCDVAAAVGPFLAQRLRTVVGSSDAVTADATVLRYADTSSGEIATAEALWGEGAAERLSADVIDALRRDAGALSMRQADSGDGAQLAAIRAALGTTVPSGGQLTFTIAPGFVAPELEELGVPATTAPLSVAVPAEVAAPLLTPFGARVLAAASDPYAGPGAVPAAAEWVDCDLSPCIALTYDDGPSGFTPELLDILHDERATAAFYLLGQYAAGNPETVRNIADAGHLIGNHTWDHPSLPDLEPEDVEEQLVRTARLLRELSGQAVSTFRPPYGAFDAAVLAEAGQPAILWNVDTRDWAGGSDAAVADTAVGQARPGGIILFHDTHERSVRMAPEVIARLRDRGFTVASLTQLFDGTLPADGAWRAAP